MIGRICSLGRVVLALVSLTVLFVPAVSYAHHCVTCTAGDCSATKAKIIKDHETGRANIKSHMAQAFEKHRKWWENQFWKQVLLPAMMKMSTQLSATGLYQMMGIGMQFDAKEQLEAQQMLQKMQARAHKDYHPSVEFCTVGTQTRSLAASAEKSRHNILALSNMALERQLGTFGNAAAEGGQDKRARWDKFITTYCNKRDNDYQEPAASATGVTVNTKGLKEVCKLVQPLMNEERINIDVDYTRQIEEPLTIRADFADDAAAKTAQEEDFLSLAHNLYGHETLDRTIPNIQTMAGASQYMNLRSVAAQRAVAENSFYNIAGMKFAGSDTAIAGGPRKKTAETMAAILKQLGMPEDEIPAFIGEKPSFYGQLEILAKKIFEGTDFFAGLYDKPANVERRKVAMAAVGLMVDRAIYESRLRQEMLASVLVSARLRPEINPGVKEVQTILTSSTKGRR